MIIHCMTEKEWIKVKFQKEWGQGSLKKCGFVHCSTPDNFPLVAPNFKNVDEPLVIVCLDEDKLLSEVKYEEFEDSGEFYPHIYGLINNDAVIDVLPFIKDSKGNYIKNREFSDISEK